MMYGHPILNKNKICFRYAIIAHSSAGMKEYIVRGFHVESMYYGAKYMPTSDSAFEFSITGTKFSIDVFLISTGAVRIWRVNSTRCAETLN